MKEVQEKQIEIHLHYYHLVVERSLLELYSFDIKIPQNNLHWDFFFN